MTVKIREIEDLNIVEEKQGIIILPYNYEDSIDHAYNSTSISFYKYAKNIIDIKFFTEPEILVEQRSGDWFAPILFLSSTAVTQNPEMIAIALSVIANYVTDFLKGKDRTNVKLKVIYKQTTTTKVTEISYEGKIEGLSSLKESIESVVNRGNSND